MANAIVPPDIISFGLGAITGSNAIGATLSMSHCGSDRIVHFGEIETTGVTMSRRIEGVEGEVGGGLGVFPSGEGGAKI